LIDELFPEKKGIRKARAIAYFIARSSLGCIPLHPEFLGSRKNKKEFLKAMGE
jgi:hypothetical protein